jgi:cytoskeletal protein CcmA (bactofilin family)
MNNNKAMKKSNKMLLGFKQQQGFTLVTVLILSSLASILVLNSLQDNVNQERLSGNYQKKTNARLMSERGVFATMQAAQAFLLANPNSTIAQLRAGLANINGDGTLAGSAFAVTPIIDGTGDIILQSTGNRFEGVNRLNARFRLTTGSGYSPFSDAVVGCEGVDLGGSGRVDSYNSNDAPYDVNNPGSEGDVSTIDKSGANVILGGASPILGNVSSTGEINTKSSDVQGNLHANGNIIIGSGTGNGGVKGTYNGSQVNLRVSGNVLTRGNYYQNGGRIGGHVRANGDASMRWSNYILNIANNGLDILYGGSADFKDTTNNSFYSQAQYKVFPNVIKVKDSDATAPNYSPTDPETNCDHLDIDTVVNTVDDGTNNLTPFNSRGSGVEYTITPNEMYVSLGIPMFTQVSADVLGYPAPVLKFKEFNLGGSDTVVIQGGDVTMFVEGDFQMAGATKMTIEAGSSLTLIMKGSVKLGAGADIIALQHGLANPPKSLPAMSIYSSYNGSGINLSGDFEMYAQIYAPLSDIKITGSGTLYGAVRGKTVTVTGGAAIHYDAALGDGNRGGGGGSSAPVFDLVGFQY